MKRDAQRCFIAHAPADAEFAARLAEDLESVGRTPDDDLDSCGTVIAVLSAAALEAVEVRDPVLAAKREALELVSVLVEDCELPPPLVGKPSVPYWGDREEALEVLRSAVGEDVGGLDDIMVTADRREKEAEEEARRARYSMPDESFASNRPAVIGAVVLGAVILGALGFTLLSGGDDGQAAAAAPARPKAPAPTRTTKAPPPPPPEPTRTPEEWKTIGTEAVTALRAALQADDIGLSIEQRDRAKQAFTKAGVAAPAELAELDRILAPEEAWHRRFQSAVSDFCGENYAKAKTAFDAMAEERPRDRRAAEYVKHIYYNLAVTKLQELEPWESVYYLDEFLKREKDASVQDLRGFAVRHREGAKLGYEYTKRVDTLRRRRAGCS
ncbi:MAG: toll/interleukin-1 receptor domain-containing protein [Acidobacteriota bacterium]